MQKDRIAKLRTRVKYGIFSNKKLNMFALPLKLTLKQTISFYSMLRGCLVVNLLKYLVDFAKDCV